MSNLVTCPLCFHANRDGTARCTQCGLPVDLTQCSSCEAVNQRAAMRCYRCGALLGSVARLIDEGLPALAPIQSPSAITDRQSGGRTRIHLSSVSGSQGNSAGTFFGVALVITFACGIAVSLFERRNAVHHHVTLDVQWLDSIDRLPAPEVNAPLPLPHVGDKLAAVQQQLPASRLNTRPRPAPIRTAASFPSGTRAAPIQAASRGRRHMPPPESRHVATGSTPPPQTQQSGLFQCTSAGVSNGQCRPEQLLTGR